MDKEMKSILKWNVIKFIIGCVLLFACYRYIEQYPAEKIAITSGFEVIIQKVQVAFDGFFHHNADAMNSRFDYEKAYQELINIAKANGCTDTTLLGQLQQTFTDLQNESDATIANTLPGYIRKANEYKSRVADSCKNTKK